MTESWPARSNAGNPPEELNPLLNPLLEQNLSRWARVYFTAPAEGRDQAVRELLRQLRSELGAGIAASPDAGAEASAVSGSKLVCTACQHANPPDQRFCGSCGAFLDHSNAAAGAAPPPAEAAGETYSFLGLNSQQPDNAKEQPDNAKESDNDLQFLREKSFGSEYYEPESASHRGRYVMAALAIILAGATYMEWPFVHSRLQSILQPMQAVQPPVAETPSPQAVAPAPVETRPAVSEETPPAAVKAPKPAPPEPEESAGKTDNAGSSTQAAGSSLTLVSHTEATGPAADGTQEFLLAQRYLDGRRAPRDGAQAAVWLWKAVSKQNTRADVVLADLYLRGDGVPKSCDQARILLAAAAKKGAPDAAEKLRNLESSGCR